MRRSSSRDGMHRHVWAPVGVLVLAVVLSCALGCGRRLLLSPEVIGKSGRGPVDIEAVHPTQRKDVRAIWTEVTDRGPFLVVRLETETDLQSLADRRNVSYVRYKAYACSENPDWLAVITSGPVFPAPELDLDLDGSRLYDIYLPIDLGAAIEPRQGRFVGVDLVNEVRKAEENGLCIVLLGAKAYGRGFSSRLTRVPASISDGKLEAAGASLPKDHHPLEIKVQLVDGKVFEPGDAIELDVTVTNRSDRSIFACRPNWNVQKGIIKLKVFDLEGRTVPVAEGIHADFVLRESTDLRVLGPGAHWQGRMILGGGERVYAFSHGKYFILANYYCPFEGERQLGDGMADVIRESQTSQPVKIEVDYRGWLQKLVAWIKRDG